MKGVYVQLLKSPNTVLVVIVFDVITSFIRSTRRLQTTALGTNPAFPGGKNSSQKFLYSHYDPGNYLWCKQDQILKFILKNLIDERDKIVFHKTTPDGDLQDTKTKTELFWS